MRKIAKVMVYTTLIFSFLNIVQIPEASARFHLEGAMYMTHQDISK